MKRLSVIVFMTTFLLTGCFSEKKDVNSFVDFQCIESQTICKTITEFGVFEVRFNVSVVKSELPFQVQVLYHGDNNLEAITGYIEGVNMFMGKIPLIFTTNQQTESEYNSHRIWKSDVLIGSCSEDKMRWALWINATFEGNEQQFFIEFVSENSQ